MSLRILPQIGLQMIVPDPIINSGRFLRLHNRVSELALKAALLEHWSKTTKKHFVKSARQRYGYADRSMRYVRQKRRRYGSVADLVKTGKAKRTTPVVMPKVKIGGSAASVLKGLAKLHWPHPIRRRPSGNSNIRVGLPQIFEEIGSWTQEEAESAMKTYTEVYTAELFEELNKAPKWKKKVMAAMGV